MCPQQSPSGTTFYQPRSLPGLPACPRRQYPANGIFLSLSLSLLVRPCSFPSHPLKVHRIAQQLDIFRLLSFFYSSVGFYINQVRWHGGSYPGAVETLVSFPLVGCRRHVVEGPQMDQPRTRARRPVRATPRQWCIERRGTERSGGLRCVGYSLFGDVDFRA